MCEGDCARTIPRRRHRRRVPTSLEFPALQSLPSVTYTETPLRLCTLGVDIASWSCPPVVFPIRGNFEWIIAATDQGSIVFWRLQDLPKHTALNVTVPPTQTLKLKDRMVRLIPQWADRTVLAITILGKMYKVSLETKDPEESGSCWTLGAQWSVTDDVDVVNIRHVTVWNKETLIFATESYLMAWSSSRECIWKHRIDNIMAMEIFGDNFLIVVPHGQAVQVLDIRQLSESVLEATVLARPGFELLPSTTEGATIIYHRKRDSSVVLAFSDGQCFSVGFLKETSDGDCEWGVIETPVQLPVPAVGIGVNRWGDVMYCLPAGSTIVTDTTGSISAAWMIPVGTGEREDIMVPVEGFCADGGYAFYQWPNGIMDVFLTQISCQKLLSSFIEEGVARDLMNWLLIAEAQTIASHGTNYIQARPELEKLGATDVAIDEVLILAPSFRRCLLSLASSS